VTSWVPTLTMGDDGELYNYWQDADPSRRVDYLQKEQVRYIMLKILGKIN